MHLAGVGAGAADTVRMLTLLALQRLEELGLHVVIRCVRALACWYWVLLFGGHGTHPFTRRNGQPNEFGNQLGQRGSILRLDTLAGVRIADLLTTTGTTAATVRSRGASTDAQALRQYVRNHLARYKVPREVVFVDALPRNPAGKIVKRNLPR